MQNLIKNARLLRKNSTDAEKKLWQRLKNRQLKYKFTRQYIFDNKYIVDFICREKNLVIEIDGGQHCENLRDKERDYYLNQRGYYVLRLWNNDIMNNFEGCLIHIQNILDQL